MGATAKSKSTIKTPRSLFSCFKPYLTFFVLYLPKADANDLNYSVKRRNY